MLQACSLRLFIRFIQAQTSLETAYGGNDAAQMHRACDAAEAIGVNPRLVVAVRKKARRICATARLKAAKHGSDAAEIEMAAIT